MRRSNKYLNLFNMIYGIISFFAFANYIHFYYACNVTIKLMYGVIGIIYFLVGLSNLKEKNKAIGIISIILGISLVGYSIMIATNIRYMLEEDIQIILVIAENILIFLFSIINLILNRKVEKNTNEKKYPIVILIIVIIINIIAFMATIYIHHVNIKNFDTALKQLQKGENSYTIAVYTKETDEWRFINEEGVELNRKKYDDIFGSFYEYNIDNKTIRFTWGKSGRNIVLIDSTGETLLELIGVKNELVLGDLVREISNNQSYNMNRKKTKDYISKPKYNYMERYDEKSKIFEEDKNGKYMYFKNTELKNDILQIVITDEIENDKELSDTYIKYNNENYSYDRDDLKIEEFYKYKKEYYLINIENNEKIKLNCNNLIYEACGDDERILLFTNGNIPFYDKLENGYFDQYGEKISTNSDYLIYDTTEKHILLMNKKKNKTKIISIENQNEFEIVDGVITQYDDFYILKSNKESKEIKILDNTFKVIAKTDEFKFIGKNFFEFYDVNVDYLYCYSNQKLKKICSSDEVGYMFINYSFLEPKIYSNDVYSNIGIIDIPIK